MECPFELPVEKELNVSSISGNFYRIVDARKAIIARGILEKYADYIVQAINSYEKLIKIKQISYEAICTGDQEASDKAIGLIEDFDQALEAEKK